MSMTFLLQREQSLSNDRSDVAYLDVYLHSLSSSPNTTFQHYLSQSVDFTECKRVEAAL
ncbi:MAG: hypothetical protein ACXV5F_01850 [Halobacteriota archaeon]